MKNKILSIILSLVMVLGMVPFAGLSVLAAPTIDIVVTADSDDFSGTVVYVLEEGIKGAPASTAVTANDSSKNIGSATLFKNARTGATKTGVINACSDMLTSSSKVYLFIIKNSGELGVYPISSSDIMTYIYNPDEQEASRGSITVSTASFTWKDPAHPYTHKDSTGADVTFSPINDLTALKGLFANGGSGYLAKDITADVNLLVKANVNLCLNDKVLNLNGHHITVNSEKTFALYDEAETKRYYDKDSSTGLWTLKASGTSDYFTTGGVITGGKATDGGCIYNSGTVNMYGGNIAGNAVSSESYTPLGGGVYNTGTFTMYGGNITGNTASSNSKVVFGGGVYNSGTFTVKNGHIDGNTAHSDTGDAVGGGVYNEGTFMMENGSISGNTASSISERALGGGVYISQGTFTMEDGSISGNTATSTGGVTGGGVNMYAGTFTMKKGAIDENTAHSTNANTQGGGVALGTKSCVFLMEDGSISNNTSSTDSTSGTAYTGGMDNKGTFIMKNGLIDGNTAYGPNGRALGGGLYANGNVGTDNGQTGDTILEGGTISNNKVIGATDALGAGVYVAGSKPFTMKNGEISGNEAQSTANTANGGGIFSNGFVTMIGGKVTENTANYGGGAYLKGNTFTMKNGEITDNTADFGGGINALAAAKVYLTADTEKTVSITGNKANKAVGGVNSLGETHLSGQVIIKDNICTTANYPVNLATSAPISIDGALTDSEIHLTHADGTTYNHDTGVLTSGFATYNDAVFTYDGPYKMITNADGELEVVLTHTHTFSKEWTSDSTGHWHECTAEGCDIKDYSTCGLAGADYSKHEGLKDDNTCDICGTVFYRPYDVSYTNSTITFKMNVLDSDSEPYTKLDCIRFDAFLRANNSGTAYDANMDFDNNRYYDDPHFAIGKTQTPAGAGYCVKNGATFTVVINAASVSEIKDFNEDNPYVWLILRPGHESNCMDYGYSSVNMTYASFYDSTVCLGKFNSLEDFKNVNSAEDPLTTLVNRHLNNETVDVGGLMGRQGLRNKEAGTVSESVGRTIIGLTAEQLENAGDKLIIVGSDGNKQVNVTVDCVYTYFYNGDTKVEATGLKDGNGGSIAAFAIIDNNGSGEDITGYGYYRVYSESLDNFMFDALYAAPEKK